MLGVIRELCKLKNISISELEINAGLSKGTMGRWDINSPSVEKVQKVADYFNVSIDYLTGNKHSSPDSNFDLLILAKEKARSGELSKEDMVKIIQMLSEELGKG